MLAERIKDTLQQTMRFE